MTFRPQFIILLLIVGFITVFGLQFNVYHYASTQSMAAVQSAIPADLASFNGALTWVKSAGYLLMFVAMVVEGPVITSAAAFAAALGYFNIFIIFILSVLGDLVGDYIYYAIGYLGRVHFVEKYGHKIGLTRERMKKMEHLLRNHPKKTLAAIKLSPLLPAPGLMMVGAAKMPVSDYTWMTFIVALPKTLLFMALGYYFGRAYDSISHYLENGQYFILFAIVVVIAVFYAYKKIAAKLSMRLEVI
ncbi:MAG: VTT domain-containing protein [Patescibacteria group bacterium]|nr:VTT domain-containing protein [Patescibacteria group bacterium]